MSDKDKSVAVPDKTDNISEIILYQPDSSLKLEIRLENETVWLTQAQIADLFGTKRPAITKHLSNIYKTGERKKTAHVPFWNMWVMTANKSIKQSIIGGIFQSMLFLLGEIKKIVAELLK
jgi:hypothetical protein